MKSLVLVNLAYHYRFGLLFFTGIEQQTIVVLQINGLLKEGSMSKKKKEYYVAAKEGVRGIILYGPSGTGKSLIAQKIAKILNANIKVIRGSDYSKNEEIIRQFSDKAKTDYLINGDYSDLYFIVFDVIDLIGKKIGASTHESGHKILNEIFEVEMNNIFVIGTTNSLDFIDPELMKEDKFYEIIKIDLPNLKEREKILQIHFQKLRRKNLLHPNLNLQLIASKTNGWTGANLSTLVREAFELANQRLRSECVENNSLFLDQDLENAILNIESEATLTNADDHVVSNADDHVVSTKDNDYLMVLLQDLENAIPKAMPNASSMDQLTLDFLNGCRFSGLFACSEKHEYIRKKLISLAIKVKSSQLGTFVSCFLGGQRGTGKTALAANVALNCGFSYVNVIAPQFMMHYDEKEKCNHIFKVLENAHKFTSSLILFDDIERLVGYNPTGCEYSNMVLQAILTFITHVPPLGKRILVMGTSSNIEFLDSVSRAFTIKHVVPGLDTEDITRVFNMFFGDIFHYKEYFAVAKRCRHIPIKFLYTAIDMARSKHGGFDRWSLTRFEMIETHLNFSASK